MRRKLLPLWPHGHGALPGPPGNSQLGTLCVCVCDATWALEAETRRGSRGVLSLDTCRSQGLG